MEIIVITDDKECEDIIEGAKMQNLCNSEYEIAQVIF